MEPIKALQVVEDIVAEMFLWVLLLPKTLLKVFRDPEWVRDYVTAQAERKDGAKFDEYLSPVLCITLSSSIPFYLYSKLDGSIFEKGMPSFPEMVIIMAVLFGLAPALWTLSVVRWKKQPLTRSILRPEFQAQCYVFSVFWVIVTVSLIVLTQIGEAAKHPSSLAASRILHRATRAILLLDILPILWLFRAERRISRTSDPSNPKARSRLSLLATLALSGVLTAGALFVCQEYLWP